ncbi:MAG TPA: LacI family DNA-binding transcriptional regulator [Solirubrobacterales bacterium]|nr:LacI family DNA-binding transcriptional regulator [Solirubrobacterales bacterium]
MRKITLRDVADRAQVHVSTASRALDESQSERLSPATIKRVRSAASELGYARDLVASGLKRGATKTVGVVVADLDNPHNAPVIRGIARELESEDFVPLVAETAEDRGRFERLLSHLTQRRVDAIVTSAAHLDGAEILERILGPEASVVLAIRGLPGSDYNTVVHDDRTGGSLAAQHLVSLGHEALAQLAGPTDIDTFVRRAEGFSRAVAAAGRREIGVGGRTDAPSFDEGRRLMEVVLNGPELPTAVFAPTDVMAVGALDAIAGRGLRCPEDVSVVGYNDIPISRYISPALTTIELPSEQLGQAAARMALDLIANPEDRGRLVELPARLIARRSTGAPTLRR